MSRTTISGLLLSVILLAHTASSVNWQGAGTINNTVISKIWTHINAKLASAFGEMSNDPTNAFVQTLSEEMNDLWNPAWNVVLTQTVIGYDVILYGYAFRNQWMWYNGITHPTAQLY